MVSYSGSLYFSAITLCVLAILWRLSWVHSWIGKTQIRVFPGTWWHKQFPRSHRRVDSNGWSQWWWCFTVSKQRSPLCLNAVWQNAWSCLPSAFLTVASVSSVSLLVCYCSWKVYALIDSFDSFTLKNFAEMLTYYEAFVKQNWRWLNPITEDGFLY